MIAELRKHGYNKSDEGDSDCYPRTDDIRPFNPAFVFPFAHQSVGNRLRGVCFVLCSPMCKVGKIFISQVVQFFNVAHICGWAKSKLTDPQKRGNETNGET